MNVTVERTETDDGRVFVTVTSDAAQSELIFKKGALAGKKLARWTERAKAGVLAAGQQQAPG